MNTASTVKKIIAGAVLSTGLAVSGFGLTAAIAQAQPGPFPLDAWPGCPNDHPQGPCHWCPGQPLPPTGNHVTNPVRWDNNICHTYYYVYFGQGNVAQNIWDGIIHHRRLHRHHRASSIETTASKFSECSAPMHDDAAEKG
ncbi:MAG: hypothetical protein WBW75_13905 [Mycobacterium sp.]|uniref:hypothetical protein n=1 Tax=Mycobacterium sp. TaxID=1785 RepID=UPI003C3D92DD